MIIWIHGLQGSLASANSVASSVMDESHLAEWAGVSPVNHASEMRRLSLLKYYLVTINAAFNLTSYSLGWGSSARALSRSSYFTADYIIHKNLSGPLLSVWAIARHRLHGLHKLLLLLPPLVRLLPHALRHWLQLSFICIEIFCLRLVQRRRVGNLQRSFVLEPDLVLFFHVVYFGLLLLHYLRQLNFVLHFCDVLLLQFGGIFAWAYPEVRPGLGSILNCFVLATRLETVLPGAVLANLLGHSQALVVHWVLIQLDLRGHLVANHHGLASAHCDFGRLVESTLLILFDLRQPLGRGLLLHRVLARSSWGVVEGVGRVDRVFHAPRQLQRVGRSYRSPVVAALLLLN